ncbi:MAG: hypothetical protein OHK0011_24070 [Turneriella sp.]
MRNSIESIGPLKAGLFAFVFICVVHAAYAFFLAVDVPMWDQWDSEAEWYKRLVTGRVDVQSLIAPHNEHRIAFTRLFNGALFTFAGGWSPLLGVYAQIPLIALAVALLCPWMAQYVKERKVAAIVLTLFTFSLPFSCANMLSSFQNQFYFMLVLALTAIALTAMAESATALLLGVLLALLSPFTMAGGIGTITVLWVLFFLRLFEPGTHRVRDALLLLTLSVGMIVHARLLVHVPGHDPLKAQNLGEFLAAFFKILGWPNIPIGFLAWGAIVLAVFSWLRSTGNVLKGLTSLSGPQRFAIGLLAWYVFQAAATAYARTHSGVMGSRYQQNFALLIPAAFTTIGVFVYRVKQERWIRWIYGIFLVGLLIRTYKELPVIQEYDIERRQIGLAAIFAAVQKDDLGLLRAGAEGRLYPRAERIWEQIHEPRLRGRHLWLEKGMSK